MGEMYTIFESQSAFSLSSNCPPKQNEKNTEKILHLSFHRTQTDVRVYVGAKDHHQNTYCNTPKNEY